METRANYALIGLFTLAVIVGAFLFVFWFKGTGGKVTLTTYQVHFAGSVSGLSNGNSVLFNGLKVGEVTELGLMPNDPSRVFATIKVDAQTPVKTDTKAQLETGGLTGYASIALQGGSAAAEALPANAVIDAQPSQLQILMKTAQDLSTKADVFIGNVSKMVDENAPALKASVANIQTLTGALADSSGNLRELIDSVDPAKVNAIVDNADQAMTRINTLLGKGEGKTMVADIAEAARSIKKLAENLSRFANTGLRQYEGLAVDGRRTLQDVGHAVRQLERDPQSILFGPKPALPEYKGR
ncbi:MlaD family protein [uncultured Rhodoblastus sp.]|uniref:MlaD family protein n=1 Tax=uncultured Rhodoblastus sp. TaxID=543037 RepID=UPI0025EA5BB1|nr:MlaD family protein [uncultured Rhodoblastus sp.]